MLTRTILSLAISLGVGYTFGVAAEPSTVTKLPEIAAATESYQKVVSGIRANRKEKSARVLKDYVVQLEQLFKETMAGGDLDAAKAIKDEQKRTAKQEDPSEGERKAMTGKLLAVRAGYERARQPFYQAAEAEKQHAVTKYLADLEVVQERLTKANRLDKAEAVKSLREKISEKGEVPDNPMEPNVASAPTGNLKLEPTVAAKIKDAVTAKTVKETAGSRAGGGWRDVPKDGAILVGFEITGMHWEGAPAIKCLKPIFLSAEGMFTGLLRGKAGGKAEVVKARPGYAISGLNTHSNSRLAGLQFVFSKYDAVSGKFLLGPQTSYNSKWYGTKLSGAPVQSDAKANLSVGVFGNTGADVDSIGLITLP